MQAQPWLPLLFPGRPNRQDSSPTSARPPGKHGCPTGGPPNSSTTTPALWPTPPSSTSKSSNYAADGPSTSSAIPPSPTKPRTAPTPPPCSPGPGTPPSAPWSATPAPASTPSPTTSLPETRPPAARTDRRPQPRCISAGQQLPRLDLRPLLRGPHERTRVLLKRYTGLDPHQLRHSAATHLGEQKIPLQLIMAKTRHRNPRYTRPGGEAVAEITGIPAPPTPLTSGSTRPRPLSAVFRPPPIRALPDAFRAVTYR